MELQQFISNVLTSIMAGVKGTEESAIQHLAVVNPRDISADVDCETGVRSNVEMICKVQQVEFDVAVTVENTDSKGVGGRVAVWGVGFGAEASEGGRNATVW